MTRPSIEEHLADAPAAVRHAVLEARGTLEPGAAAVMGRFFAAKLAEARAVDHVDCSCAVSGSFV